MSKLLPLFVCITFYITKHYRAIKDFGLGNHPETCTPNKSTKSTKKIKSFADAKQAAIDFAESVS